MMTALHAHAHAFWVCRSLYAAPSEAGCWPHETRCRMLLLTQAQCVVAAKQPATLNLELPGPITHRHVSAVPTTQVHLTKAATAQQAHRLHSKEHTRMSKFPLAQNRVGVCVVRGCSSLSMQNASHRSAGVAAVHTSSTLRLLAPEHLLSGPQG